MSDFLKYLRAQMKRTAKLYPAILCFTLALVVGVSIVLAVLFGNNAKSEENKRIRVGIVGDLENSYLDIGISALKSMDTSRFYIEFEQMTEEEAYMLCYSLAGAKWGRKPGNHAVMDYYNYIINHTGYFAICGARGCIRACVSMLEKPGGCMAERFKKPLRRTGKAWKMDR